VIKVEWFKELLRSFKAIPIATEYWRPGSNYIEIIMNAVRGKIRDGDYLALSEKALSIATGNLMDESRIKPGFLAKLLASVWTRIVWGYLLGPLCHLREETIWRIRNYPKVEGSIHKEASLRTVGLLDALLYTSEGGIDCSNLPESYVCLPLKNPEHIAEEVKLAVKEKLGKNIKVVIVDTDKTYSYRGLHISSRKSCLKGIYGLGFIAYLFGRALRWKARATPIALSGSTVNVEEALNVAELANRFRGHGAGRTVWEMAERFGVPPDKVSWRMIESVEHRPIVIIRRRAKRLKRRKSIKVDQSIQK